MAASLMGSRGAESNPDPDFINGLRDQLKLSREPPARVSRAGLLKAAGFWVAGVAAGLGVAWGVGAARPTSRPSPPETEIRLQGGNWFPVGSLADIGTNAVVSVDAGAVPAFIIRQGDNVRGLSRVCTHMGCLLRYEGPEGEFACPCHGATFDLNGNIDPEYGSNLPPLPAVGVRVVKGTVYVLGA
jgi:nitrite reductase/ring-hydroxylating ferredoxin subunit